MAPAAEEWYGIVWEAVRRPEALEPLAPPEEAERLAAALESRGLPGLPARFYAALVTAARGLSWQLLSLDPSDPGDCEVALPASGEAERLAAMLARDAAQERLEYKLPQWAWRLADAAVSALRASARLAREACEAASGGGVG